jgi:DNA-3-methyladenine glycosylase I
VKRCGWVGEDPLHVDYHDAEWGLPSFDDHHLFEMLTLEGAQAGLSWSTILRKRDGYREAFSQFDPGRVARYSDVEISRLLEDPQIVRNRLKITSAVTNARAFLQVQNEVGTFASSVWGFVDHRPIQNHWSGLTQIPAETAVSAAMSRDLRKRGFRFVGPTICYAFMQAVGMVNYNEGGCFRHKEVARPGA